METADTATTVETGEGNQEPVQTTTEPAEPFIVGANSVYKDVPSLLEGARQKEALIETLKAEKRELEARMKAITNLQQFQEDIKKMDTVTQQPAEVTQPTSQLTEEKVQELALKALQQQQQQTLKDNNLKTVQDTLQKVFGAEADNKVEAKCKELGISKEFGLSIAKDSPKAFLKMLGLEDPTMVSVESLIAKGRIADTTASSQPTQPLSDIERLQQDRKLAHNRAFLQQLFKEGMKDPMKVLGSYQEWQVPGK